MKKVLLAFVLTACAVFSQAQTIAYTQDGKRVILFSNGTWFYADSLYGNNNNSPYNYNNSYNNTQGAQEMFMEAYDYAMDLLYGDEFFRNERENKAGAWAADYVRSNIQINIGRKTLGQWFDELNTIAYNYIYKNEFFGNDRKQKAINWAKGLIEQKASYDWSSFSSKLARTREAYNVAYNKIFVTEFFANDRKKKSVDWANQFMRNRR